MDDSDLFGTAEPRPAWRALRAGPLSAVLEAGQLRDVRWHGVLVLRGLAYLLRDAGWGTLPVAVSGLDVEEAPGRFRVTYEAEARGPSGRLRFRMAIEGTAEGTLSCEAAARALTDFTTNRVGFVVLHPDAAAGLPLRVRHPDGSADDTAFPRLIAPHQPAFDIVGLSHAPAPGVTAELAFEGGVWEMEDQRNWSDASFKTYVRPLALPFPYVIPEGAEDRQAVRLRLAGVPGAVRAASARRPLAAAIPPLWLRVAPGALPEPPDLPLGRGLVLRLDRAGEAPRADALALAARRGLRVAVEAVLPLRDPEAEARALLAALAGHPVEALLLAARRDLQTRPTGLPDGEAPLADLVAAVRAGGFAGRVGTGAAAYFTELNRNPPPPADLAFFGVNPIVHAADEASVVETLEALPAILESARALLPGVPLWPGPLALPAFVNPYGPGLVETDGLTRTTLAARDPRHGALFGAAHLVGALAAVLPFSEAVAPLHLNGPGGIAGPGGAPLPLAFVLAEVAAAEGARGLEGPGPASLAWESGGRRAALLANLSDEPVEAPAGDDLLPGPGGWAGAEGPLGPYRVRRLRP